VPWKRTGSAGTRATRRRSARSGRDAASSPATRTRPAASAPGGSARASARASAVLPAPRDPRISVVLPASEGRAVRDARGPAGCAAGRAAAVERSEREGDVVQHSAPSEPHCEPNRLERLQLRLARARALRAERRGGSLRVRVLVRGICGRGGGGSSSFGGGRAREQREGCRGVSEEQRRPLQRGPARARARRCASADAGAARAANAPASGLAVGVRHEAAKKDAQV